VKESINKLSLYNVETIAGRYNLWEAGDSTPEQQNQLLLFIVESIPQSIPVLPEKRTRVFFLSSFFFLLLSSSKRFKLLYLFIVSI